MQSENIASRLIHPDSLSDRIKFIAIGSRCTSPISRRITHENKDEAGDNYII